MYITMPKKALIPVILRRGDSGDRIAGKPGVTSTEGDFDDPASLLGAREGVDRAFRGDRTGSKPRARSLHDFAPNYATAFERLTRPVANVNTPGLSARALSRVACFVGVASLSAVQAAARLHDRARQTTRVVSLSIQDMVRTSSGRSLGSGPLRGQWLGLLVACRSANAQTTSMSFCGVSIWGRCPVWVSSW